MGNTYPDIKKEPYQTWRHRIEAKLNLILHNQEIAMKEFDDLSATVDQLIAADEAETTLLVSIKASLDALLANPTGVSPTDVTALRDRVAAELDKVTAATTANTPTT